MLQIDARQIRSCVTMPGLVAALASPPAWPAVPERHQHGVNGQGVLLLMPAWDGSVLGTKIVTWFPDNKETEQPTVIAHYLLVSARTGAPIALIDGTELTLWRTAAVAAVAAIKLAPAHPENILVIGTGALAPATIEAHLWSFPAARVSLWGRDCATADALSARLGIGAEPDLAAAARRADIICCVTSSKQPVLRGAWLKDEAHVSLIGSFAPDMREADDAVLQGAAVYADSPAALAESGDLAAPIAGGIVVPSKIVLLPDLAERAEPRPSRTIFKSVGNAGYDLVAACHIVDRVKAANV